MATSERLTAPAANAASVLDHELRRTFEADGVIDFQERRLLKLSGALNRHINEADAQIGVLLCGFRIDGIRGRQFKRRLREFDRDFDPEPSGPVAAKREAA